MQDVGFTVARTITLATLADADPRVTAPASDQLCSVPQYIPLTRTDMLPGDYPVQGNRVRVRFLVRNVGGNFVDVVDATGIFQTWRREADGTWSFLPAETITGSGQIFTSNLVGQLFIQLVSYVAGTSPAAATHATIEVAPIVDRPTRGF